MNTNRTRIGYLLLLFVFLVKVQSEPSTNNAYFSYSNQGLVTPYPCPGNNKMIHTGNGITLMEDNSSDNNPKNPLPLPRPQPIRKKEAITPKKDKDNTSKKSIDTNEGERVLIPPSRASDKQTETKTKPTTITPNKNILVSKIDYSGMLPQNQINSILNIHN
ncbi:hypothetical protein HMI56_005475, partial [Coelomomyces lativittatus]